MLHMKFDFNWPSDSKKIMFTTQYELLWMKGQSLTLTYGGSLVIVSHSRLNCTGLEKTKNFQFLS